MKFYLLSPQCPLNPHLFPMFIPHWRKSGVNIVDRIEDCDIVIFDLHVRRFDYDQKDIDWTLKHNTSIATFDEWDRGNMSNEEWPYPVTNQQKQILHHIDTSDMKAAHFCRLLNKRDEWESGIYPYEKPILHSEALLTPDELFNRPYDICFIANTAPSRERIAKTLESDKRLNCIIRLGEPKIEFNNFVETHKKAKLFISSGAGGYTDERKQNLFSVAGLIQEENDQLLLHPFTHLENCIKINNPPTKKDLDTIFEVCNDKERLYEIYRNGCDFMQTYYSAEYIANDILEKIIKHCA